MADFKVVGETMLDPSGFATGVAGMAKTGAKVIGAGVAAMSAAIGAGMAAATAYGSAFESAVAKVSTLVDTASPQGVQALENLEASFLKTSTATGQTAEALAEAGYQALSAGVSAQSAGAFVETAAKLATGGFTETASAVDVLSTAINAYGLEEKDAQHISDALIQTQNLGKTTVDELAGSLGRVAPSAAAYKVSMEDTLTALAQMTKGGISTAESTTYLKGMLNELAKEGSKVSGILQDETGASFSELMEQGYSLGDVMQILGDSVDNNATAFANLWSSQEAGTGALSILNQGTADYNETLRSITDSAGATEGAFGKMMDTFESKMGILKTSAQNLGIAVYQGMQEPMAGMAEIAIGYVQTLADAFEQNGPEGLISALGTVLGDLVGRAAELAPTVVSLAVELLKSMAAAIVENAPVILQGLKDALGAVLDGAAELAPALKPLTDALKWLLDNLNLLAPAISAVAGAYVALKAVGTAQKIVKGVTDVVTWVQKCGGVLGALKAIIAAIGGPITIVIAVVAALVAGFVYLWNTCEPFRQFWIDLWNGIVETVTGIGEGLVEFFTVTIPEAFNSFCEFFSGLFADIGASVTEFFGSLPQRIGEAIEAALNFFAQLPERVAFFIGQVIGHIILFGQNLMSFCTETVPAFINSVATWFSQLPGRIWEWLSNAIQKVASWAVDTVDRGRKAASEFLSNVIEFFTQLPGKVWTWLTNTITKVKTFVTDMGEKATQAAKDFYDNLVEGVSKLPEKFLEIGGNIVDGIWNGIKSGWDWLITSVKDLATSLYQGVCDVLGIESPSKKFAWIGRMSAEGMEKGFAENDPADDISRRLNMDFGRMTAALRWTGGPSLAGVPGTLALAGAAPSGPVNNYYTATIDAKNVREWNDVVKVFQRHEAVVRQWRRR